MTRSLTPTSLFFFSFRWWTSWRQSYILRITTRRRRTRREPGANHEKQGEARGGKEQEEGAGRGGITGETTEEEAPPPPSVVPTLPPPLGDVRFPLLLPLPLLIFLRKDERPPLILHILRDTHFLFRGR